jgi:4-amino-4-deoxy-L-arabinose transferase-like glycosyltransferase
MNRLDAPQNRHSASPNFLLSKASMLCIIVGAWLLVYVPGLFHPSLLDDADSVHAEASREILLNHDWVTLYVDGIRYLAKAPLMYWLVAISYRLFGISEWQTRLPLAICVLVLAWCVYIFGRRFIGKEVGFWAALITVTSPGFYVFTRFLIPEVMVAIFLALGLYFFLIACEQSEPSRWVCWGIAVTVALNILTKGLIGLVFPVGIMLACLILTGDLKKIWKLHPISSTLVFLVVAVPWHALAAIRNPAQPTGPEKGFLWSYFVNEQFMRFLNKRIPHDYGKVPLLLFYGLLLLWVLPWCVFLFPALKEIPLNLRPWRDRLDARGRANLLLGIWIAVIVGFFSFSSRQEYYSLPAVPALALLIAGWLQRENNSPAYSRDRHAGRIASAVLLGIGGLVFLACISILAQTHPFPPGTDIGEVLTAHPESYNLSLGHMQDLTIESFGMFRVLLWGFSVPTLLGTGLNWYFRRRGSALKANLALALMMVAILLCVHQGFVIFSPEISSKSLALAIRKEYKPGQTIAIYRDYESGASITFYTRERVHIVDGLHADLWFGSLFPDVPHVFEDHDSFVRLWSGPSRVYLFTEGSLVNNALNGINPKTVHALARSGGKIVFTNQPSALDSNAPSSPNSQ